MGKKFVRWYEKDECLKAFMDLLEDLDEEIQCEIAIDIIIKASDMIDRDYMKLIQEVGTYDPRNFKRWYDQNPNVHLAIESLKDLNEQQRGTLVREYTDKILSNHYIQLEDVN